MATYFNMSLPEVSHLYITCLQAACLSYPFSFLAFACGSARRAAITIDLKINDNEINLLILHFTELNIEKEFLMLSFVGTNEKYFPQ